MEQIQTVFGKILYQMESPSLKNLLESAVRSMTDLHEADLHGSDLRLANLHWAKLPKANFYGANLRGANFHEADLSKANFYGANLRQVNFHGADLSEASFRFADLRGADLGEANLRLSDFHRADLYETSLDGSRLNWGDNELLAKILFQAAGEDVERRKIAGLVAISRDWCWEDFLAIQDPLKKWAIQTLSQHLQPGDDAPPSFMRLPGVCESHANEAPPESARPEPSGLDAGASPAASNDSEDHTAQGTSYPFPPPSTASAVVPRSSRSSKPGSPA